MTDIYSYERAKKIVTVEKVLSALVIVAQILIIILYHFDVWTSQKKMILALGLLPWVRYIYALIFAKLTCWDEANAKSDDLHIRSTAAWKETHIEFFHVFSFFQGFILLYDMLTLFCIAQTYKGFSKILILWGLIWLLMMVIGYFRIEEINKGKQMLYYGFMMAIFIGLTVNSTCYYLSSPATHEECTFVSKSYSHSTKGGTTYYVTVKLQDGTEYESMVGSDLYKKAEETKLVTCHREGPFGIEYLRVHGS
ncbi:hypothetical protein [Butyrivibrio sp. VCB2006]|uniref:hypothetical protein n=1 Tax=Butyrivibrio sp. VCB2006 TaxID=1280679 RepID=UPI0004261065|nr:hypothetical protein [Butyrivibrio sp. VCB2006]